MQKGRLCREGRKEEERVEMGMQSLPKSQAEKVRVAWLVSMAMSA